MAKRFASAMVFGSLLMAHAGEVVATIQSVSMSTNDVRVIDVVYSVRSEKSPTIGAFLIAYPEDRRSVDGIRVARSFSEGAGENVGTSIVSNVSHALKWHVDDDMYVCSGRLKLEVLAVEDVHSLIQLSCIKILEEDRCVYASINDVPEEDFFNALLWLYAAGTYGITRDGDALVSSNEVLAQGVEVTEKGAEFVYSVMGYARLTGVDLDFVNRKMRLNLSPHAARQYAIWRTRAD